MKLTLHPDWKRILTRAWSMRLNYGVALFEGVDAAFAYIIEGRIGTSLAVVGMSVAVSIARIVKQQDLVRE